MQPTVPTSSSQDSQQDETGTAASFGGSAQVSPPVNDPNSPQPQSVSPEDLGPTPSSGINTTPIVQVKQVDASKGFWKLVTKVFGLSRIAAKMQADMQLEQNYANQHGLQYQANTQVLPTGQDGVGSALLSADGSTIFYHHMSGIIQDHPFDSIVWFHRHFKTTAHGFSEGSQPNFPEVDTILAGRITIPESVPSLILASKSSGLAVADPHMFTRFQNAGTVNLEGDFNTYFSVFAPQQDPVSAFQALPPNLMAVLIDEYKDTCIEFSGQSIYLLLLTNATQNSFGNDKPVFNPQDNDRIASQLLRLASFFNLSVPENQYPVNPSEIITDKQVPTVNIG